MFAKEEHFSLWIIAEQDLVNIDLCKSTIFNLKCLGCLEWTYHTRKSECWHFTVQYL